MNRYNYAAAVASVGEFLFGYADVPVLPGSITVVFLAMVVLTMAVDAAEAA